MDLRAPVSPLGIGRTSLRMAAHRKSRASDRTYQRFLLDHLEPRTLLTVVFHSPLGGDTIYWESGNAAGGTPGATISSPITYNPGALQNPKVYLIFYGSSWTSTTAQKFANDAQTILNSNYLSGLTDYGASGTAQWGGYTIDNSAATALGPGDGSNEINKIVPTMSSWSKPTQAASTPGSFYWPGANGSPIYFVIFDNGGGGGNGMGIYQPTSSSSKLAMNHSWIGDGGLSEDSFNDIFSHELVERISTGGGGILMRAPYNITGESNNAQISDNEPDAEHYTYRLQGSVLVQAYWSLSRNAFIVPDGNPQVVDLFPQWNTSGTNALFSGVSSLEVTGDTTSTQTVAIGVNSGGGAQFVMNSQVFNFDQGVLSAVTVNTGGVAGSSFSIFDTVVPTYLNSLGETTVNIGNNGNVQGIQAPVVVNGSSPFNSLIVNDANDTTPRGVIVTSTDISGLAPADIEFRSNNLGSLQIDTGTPGADVTVQDTPDNLQLIPTVTTILGAAGSGNNLNIQGTTGDLVIDGNSKQAADTIVVGSKAPSLHGNLANIVGLITITNTSNAKGSSTFLTVDDSADPNGQTGTIGPNIINGFGMTGDILYTGSTLTGLTVLAGRGSNTVNVTGTSTPTTVKAGSGNSSIINVQATAFPLTINGQKMGDQVNIGSMAPSLGGTLAGIQAPVTITNMSADSAMTVDGSGDATNQTGAISRTSITGFGMGSAGIINFTGAQFSSLNVLGGTGVNTFAINDTSTSTTLNTGGNNTTPGTLSIRNVTKPLAVINDSNPVDVTIGSKAPGLGGSLAGIKNSITMTNASVRTLTLDDVTDTAAGSSTVSDSTITGMGMGVNGIVNYDSAVVAGLTLRYGHGANMVSLSATGTHVSLVAPLASGSTLVGPDTGATWHVNGTGAGTIPAFNVTFSGFQHLVGGAGNDTFAIDNGASVKTIDGGAGTNTLDYSAFSGNVVVNLRTGQATAVHNGVSNIQNVIGAHGGGTGFYNVLVGNGGNTLTGGDNRRNLLIAGATASTLIGGNRDDILVGGTTSYDTQVGSLKLVAIAKFWSNATTSYTARVAALLAGKGTPALNATTSHDNGGSNILTGHNGTNSDLNLYYGISTSGDTTDINTGAGELFEII